LSCNQSHPLFHRPFHQPFHRKLILSYNSCLVGFIRS
jgi:hypothetical protein